MISVLIASPPTGAAIQAAHDAASAAGDTIYIPAAEYEISAPLNLSKPLRYVGDGYGTVLKAMRADQPVINWTGFHATMEHVRFTAGVPQVAGSIYVNCQNAARFKLSDFSMSGFEVGIRYGNNCSGGIIVHGEITEGNTGTGIGILADGAQSYDLSLAHLIIGATGQLAAGIRFTDLIDATITDVQCVLAGYGLDLYAAGGKTVGSLLVSDSYFDNCLKGIRLYANGAGSKVVRNTFTACWGSAGKEQGMMLLAENGGCVDGNTFVAPNVTGSFGNGLMCYGDVRNTDLMAPVAAQCGASGIATVGPVDGLRVSQGRIGATDGLVGNQYGIFLSGGAVNCSIRDTDLHGNTTALADGGAATFKENIRL